MSIIIDLCSAVFSPRRSFFLSTHEERWQNFKLLPFDRLLLGNQRGASELTPPTLLSRP